MNESTANIDAKTSWLSGLDEAERAEKRRESPRIEALRACGRESFERQGFPTPRLEDWMYTSVAPIVQGGFRPARPTDVLLGAEDALRHTFGDDWSALLVFVNGRYVGALSRREALPEGLTVMPLGEALALGRPGALERLGTIAGVEASGFAALNAAFFSDGAYVEIARGAAVEKPVHVLHLAHAPLSPLTIQPRNLFVVEAGANACIVENYSNVGEHAYFRNAVTEIALGENAHLEHYRLGRESDAGFHVSWTEVKQARYSSFSQHSITTGGRIVRNDLNVVQAGDSCQTTLYGLYLAQGSQHVDNHTAVDHASPHGTSVEYYRGVLDGQARGVFNGKVIVRPGAIKTDAAQTNHNLLLTEDALIDTKPQLEIFNNDVKCSHGATVGQLDPHALFYVRSRGLSEKAARSLLTFGFASDVVGRIKIEPLRARLSEYLAHRFSRDIDLGTPQ